MILEKEPSYIEFTKTLKEFGISKIGIEFYVSLLRQYEALNPSKIAIELSKPRAEMYKAVRELEGLGLISKIPDKTQKYVAVPLNEVVQKLIKTKELKLKNQIYSLTESAKNVDALLKNYQKKPIQVPELFYNLLVGEAIYTQANILAMENEKVYVVGTTGNIKRLDLLGFFDNLKHECQMVLPKSSIEQVKECLNAHVNVKIKDKNDLPHFIMNDEQIILFVSNEPKSMNETKALWTNFPGIVKSERMLFEQLYNVE